MPASKLDNAIAGRVYGENFYHGQIDGSTAGARLYSELLWRIYQPASIVDFGCGRGAWLSAFAALGAKRLVGLDGPWNSQSDLVDQAIEFRPADLNEGVAVGPAAERFDLAMSLEVAEHLRPESSANVVRSLCGLSDVVMFGAAFLHQGGSDHINLRLPSFWAGLFAEQDYAVFDYFRPHSWGLEHVPFFYQQNTYLYVRNEHPLAQKLAQSGCRPVDRLALLDAAHPSLLAIAANESGLTRLSRETRQFVKGKLPDRLVKVIRSLK